MQAASRSFAEDVAAQTKRIRAMALRFTRDEEDAHDLAQEVLIKAILNADKFDGSNLNAWLTTITRNLFITDYNRKKKQSRHLEPSDELYGSNLLTASVPPIGPGEMERQRIEYAYSKLGETHLQTLDMRRQGFKYEEIAETTHTPVGTVKNRIFKAREYLSKHLHQTPQPMNPMKYEEPTVEEKVKTSYDKAADYLRRELLNRPDKTAGVLIKAEDLARRTGVSPSMASFALPALCDSGYLRKEKQGVCLVYWGVEDKLINLTGEEIKNLAVDRARGKVSPKLEIHAPEPAKPQPEPAFVKPEVKDKVLNLPAGLEQDNGNIAGIVEQETPADHRTLIDTLETGSESPKEVAEKPLTPEEQYKPEPGTPQETPAEMQARVDEELAKYKSTLDEKPGVTGDDRPGYTAKGSTITSRFGPTIVAPKEYGYIDEDQKVVWCSDQPSAINAAKTIARIDNEIALVVKIGKVHTTPTVTLFE